MVEFMSILISFIFMGIADSINAAFNNLISIDAIVVCSSLFSIDLILKSMAEIGVNTYRTIRKHEWAYLWMNISVSLILGIIVLLTKDWIINLFHLTGIQKNMLSQLLNLYILYLPIGRMTTAIFEMTRLKGNLKLYRKSLAVFYFTVIGLDSLFYLLTKNLFLLFIANMLSWIISAIYMLSHLKIKFEFPNHKTFHNIMKYGVPTSLERLLSRIFLLLYGVIASRLGTSNYSIHAICYSVCLNLEIITSAYQATLMIKVPEQKTYEEQYRVCMKLKKDCFPIIILLNFIFAFIYLLISHGSLPIENCFPYIIFYSLSVFGSYPYETYKSLCIIQGKPFILLIGSIIGAIIRVCICILFINSPIVLYVFGIVNLIDFYLRSRIYKKGLARKQSSIFQKSPITT